MSWSKNLGETIKSIKAVLGNKSDYITVPFTENINSAMAFLVTGYYHIHGTPFVYPRLTNSVLITSAALAWANSGDIIEVIPANALSSVSFDLHWINVVSISANLEGLIEIFHGPVGEEELIGETRIFKTDNFTTEGAKRIQVGQQLKNTRISCRFSDNTALARTCAVSFEGHYYG